MRCIFDGGVICSSKLWNLIKFKKNKKNYLCTKLDPIDVLSFV